MYRKDQSIRASEKFCSFIYQTRNHYRIFCWYNKTYLSTCIYWKGLSIRASGASMKTLQFSSSKNEITIVFFVGIQDIFLSTCMYQKDLSIRASGASKKCAFFIYQKRNHYRIFVSTIRHIVSMHVPKIFKYSSKRSEREIS